MACAPTRVGSDAALQLSLAKGEQLSKHCKMKRSLFRSSLWHKSCEGQPHVWHIRNMALQAVAIEEMEASEFTEKKTLRWHRWQAHETMVLIAAKKQHDLGQSERTEGIEKKKARDRWKEIEAFCQEKGIERSAEQCQTRWSRLISAYIQIRSWEENKTPEELSFWSMKLDEKKNEGFLLFLDRKTYDALDEIHNKKADDIKNALVEDDGEVHKGDELDNQLPGGSKNDEKVQSELLSACKPNCEEESEMYIRDVDAKFSSQEIKGCKSEKQGDPCKDMESTKIFSTYLHDQVEVGDSIKAQLPHASGEKMDCNHKELHKSEHAESLKVLGTVEHTNPMVYCDEKDVNNYNIAQLLHASKEMDGSNKGYLEEHGIEEHINVMPRDDNNSQFSPITHDRTMPTAKEGMEELSGVDGSSLAYHETNFSHTDSLEAGGIVHANDFSASVEKHDCQETVSALSFVGVDVLDENLSGQVAGTAGSCMSMDEQGCKNLSEERNPAKEVCIDKNEKAEGFFEVCKDNSPCHKNADDFSNAWVNKTQSNYMEAEGKSDVSQKVEDMVAQINSFVPIVEEAFNRDLHSSPEQQQLGLNPVMDSKEETGTDGVFEHGHEDDDTFPCTSSSEISESTSSIGKASGDVQDWHFQKNQSREDHAKRNAGIEEEIASAFEHSSRQSFKGGELQNGSADYNEKTTKHSQIFEHFEVAVKDGDALVKTERCGQSQHVNGREGSDATDGMKAAVKDGDALVKTERCGRSQQVNGREGSDATDGMKVAIKEVVYLTEMMETRGSTVDAGDSLVETELCGQSQLVRERSDATDRVKVAIKEGVYLTEMIETRAGTVDAGTSALSSIQHQFHHASSTLERKEDRSSGKDCEVKRSAASETELEFVIKDGRERPVTTGKGTVEDQSQKSNNSSKLDEDVFMYIPAAIGSLVRSVLQTIRNFLKF